MGTFLFRWPHPEAHDVHVTGTFDDWGKSEQLIKVGDVWEKEVNLPSADEKVLYKFVVNDEWIVDPTAPQEGDGHWNINNVLYPHEIKRHAKEDVAGGAAGAAAGAAAAAPLISSVGPESTTAKLAGDVPVERPELERQISPPGAFPETPATEAEQFSAQPVPEMPGIGNPANVAPGEKVPPPSDLTSNTIDSTATTSKEGYERDASAPVPPEGKADEQKFGVDPIPATSGIGNPISLAPGEKVPDSSTITSDTVDSTITTSKEGYEKDASAAFPSESKAEEQKFGVDPIPATEGIGNPITLAPGEKVPEPSAVTSNTVDSTATTSKSAYDKAGEAVAGLIGGTAIGAAVASAFKKPDEKPKGTFIPESSLPMYPEKTDSLDAGPTISSVGPNSTTAGLAGAVPLEEKRQGVVLDSEDGPPAASSVPEVVKESLTKAHQSAEGAAWPESVAEKSAVEAELLKKTTSSEAVGEPASAAGAQTSYYGLATSVPETVEKSMAQAHAAPEAATEASVVAEKSLVEQELLKKIPSSEAAGEHAPTITAATSEVAPAATTTTKETPAEEPSLADEPAVKMMNIQDTPTAKTETNAPPAAVAAETKAPAAPATPATPATSEAKKPGTAQAAASKVMTPVKKPVTTANSTPSTTTSAKDKKKRHRISGFFKKIFD